jgi:hypothetical protein
MAKKTKRYDDGGEVEGGLREVSKSRFDDDTNARAKSFVDSGYRAEAIPVENEPAPKARPLNTAKLLSRPTAKPDMSSDQISRNAPAAKPDMSSDQISRNAPAAKSSYTSPSRISDNRNGPVGDAVDAVKKYYDKGSPNMPSVKREKKEHSDNTLLKKKSKDTGMAKGGSVFSRGDGIAQRGKTKARVV